MRGTVDQNTGSSERGRHLPGILTSRVPSLMIVISSALSLVQMIFEASPLAAIMTRSVIIDPCVGVLTWGEVLSGNDALTT